MALNCEQMTMKHINPFKLKCVLDNINIQSVPQRKHNHYKDKLINKIIFVYSENYMKPINTLCRQNAELLIVEASGTYSYHETLKG
jgi:hypothetical protein